MSNEASGIIAEQPRISEAENQKGIDNHRTAATHLERQSSGKHSSGPRSFGSCLVSSKGRC